MASSSSSHEAQLGTTAPSEPSASLLEAEAVMSFSSESESADEPRREARDRAFPTGAFLSALPGGLIRSTTVRKWHLPFAPRSCLPEPEILGEGGEEDTVSASLLPCDLWVNHIFTKVTARLESCRDRSTERDIAAARLVCKAWAAGILSTVKRMYVRWGTTLPADVFYTDQTTSTAAPALLPRDRRVSTEQLQPWIAARWSDADSLNHLERLKKFLSSCAALQRLFVYGIPSVHPREVSASLSAIGTVKSLVDLQLYGKPCASDEEVSLCSLPETFSNLEALERIELRCISWLGDVQVLCTLPRLQHLTISQCGVRTLPELKELRELKITNPSIRFSFPQSLGASRNLRVLWVWAINGHTELPGTIGALSALEELDLENFSALRTLPDATKDLPNLRRLSVSGCRGQVREQVQRWKEAGFLRGVVIS